MRQTKQTPFSPNIGLQRLTKKSHGLRLLLKQASKRNTLTEIFDSSVASLFVGKFEVNGISDQILTLTCPSAALMTRFQCNKAQVINQINIRIAPQKIQNIKIKVRPRQFIQNLKPNSSDNNGRIADAPTTQTKNKISKKNAQILHEEAEHTDDIKLRNILNRLADHSNQKNSH